MKLKTVMAFFAVAGQTNEFPEFKLDLIRFPMF